FTPDLVCGVFAGFDDPEPLGSHETGASVAVPIFKKFIAEAIKGKPAIPFRVPPGLRMVRVNPETEELAKVGEKEAIWESFIPGTEPQEGQQRPVLDGSVTGAAAEGAGNALNPMNTTTTGTAYPNVTVIDGEPQPQQQQPSPPAGTTVISQSPNAATV